MSKRVFGGARWAREGAPKPARQKQKHRCASCGSEALYFFYTREYKGYRCQKCEYRGTLAPMPEVDVEEYRAYSPDGPVIKRRLVEKWEPAGPPEEVYYEGEGEGE